MVESLCCAGEWLQAEPCIVSYSDIFYELSAVKCLIKNQGALALTYDPNWLELWARRFADPLSDAETFRLASENELSEIGKQPNSTDEIQGQYMGLLRITPQGWKEILRLRAGLSPRERDNIDMTGILQMVLEEKKMAITPLPYIDKWGEIDSLHDLLLYEEWPR